MARPAARVSARLVTPVEQIVRAALESIGYQAHNVVGAMATDTHVAIDGCASAAVL